MTGRRLVVLVGRALVVGALVAGALVAVRAVQDRAEVDEQAHAVAHRAVVDLQDGQDGRAEIADEAAAAEASAVARRADEAAAVATIVALDGLQTLQDRIQLAEGELARAREASVAQVARLDILRGCVHHLELARSRYVAGDQAGAVDAFAVGTQVCIEAEALTGGAQGAAHPFDFPDPYVMREGSTYYAFGTNGPAGTVQVVSSENLGNWQVRGPALTAVPAWARPGYTWAPSAIRTSDGFTLFYTVKNKFSGQQCISRARSDSPVGPYVDTSTEPLVCQFDQGGSIDPSPYYDATGGLHLIWKAEAEVVGGTASLWTVQLTADGNAFAWFPVKLLALDREWEGRTVEGPSMAVVDEQWVLIYSGNRWDAGGYSTGYATCAGPVGPCAKPAENIVLRSDGTREGPGGAEFFRTADGQLKVAYAAWDAGEVGIPNPRRLHLGTVSMTPLGLRIT